MTNKIDYETLKIELNELLGIAYDENDDWEDSNDRIISSINNVLDYIEEKETK